MADKWTDEREGRDWRRTERDGRDGLRRYSEPRTFEGDDQGPAYEGDGGYEGGREAMFGERDSGPSYGRADAYRGERPARSGWQDADYGGVSPAIRRGGYGGRPRVTGEDYTRGYGVTYGYGGRFYGDDGRERVYREEYGRGDPAYSPTRARYHGQGHSEPGFDDDLRGEARGERFERAGRHAGDFLHRAGERVANWFAGASEGRDYESEQARRGARGLGPQGYRRSDERINDDAHERLTDDPWLDATMIIISVSAGEVTLSGTVTSREAKHRAERIVEDISGVTHVQNNLRLAKPGVLRSDATGYGDVVAEAQMRVDDPAANGTGGAGAGQSTAGRKS